MTYNRRYFLPLFGNRHPQPEIDDTFTAPDGALADGTYLIDKGKRIISNAASNSPSISSNRLIFNTLTGNRALANWTEQDGTQLTMAVGHCLAVNFTYTSGVQIYIGYGLTSAAFQGGNNLHNFRINGSTLNNSTPGVATLGSWNTANTNRFYIVYGAGAGGGTYLLRRDLTEDIVRLYWVNDFPFFAGSGAYPFLSANLSVGAIDTLRHVRLPYQWRNVDALKTYSLSSATDGQLIPEITANCFFTRNWTPSAGETAEFSFRRTDADNRIFIRAAEATAASNPNTCKIIKREAGVELELATVARTMTAGTAYELKALLHDTEIVAWMSLTRIAAITNSFNSTVDGGQVSGSSGFGTGRVYASTVTGQMRTYLEQYAL